jgi:lipoate---protein ligase
MSLISKIIISRNPDPFRNLAVEDCLLKNVRENEIILFMWQSESAVVIGKNQNPWLECNPHLLRADGVKLARRFSGGGAVYQDLGNLNYSFIMDRNLYDQQNQMRVVINAIEKMEIRAGTGSNNSLVIDKRKFSGNSFSLKADRAMHHGTILVSTDFSNMSAYLKPAGLKITARSVGSNPMEVVNLATIEPSLNVDVVAGLLAMSFDEMYETKSPITYGETALDAARINEAFRKFATWDWNYGYTPEFKITFNDEFTWGKVEMVLSIKKGFVQNVLVNTSVDEISDIIQSALPGCRFTPRRMFEAVTKKAPGNPRLTEISGRLEKLFI